MLWIVVLLLWMAAEVSGETLVYQRQSTASVGQDHNRSIGFTPREQAYLARKKAIRVCTLSDWMPYSGFDGKQGYGILIDFYRAFAQKMGVPVRFLYASGHRECVEKVESGKADAVVSVGTPNRYGGLILSREFGRDFAALVTRIETPFVSRIETLRGKKIGVPDFYVNLIAYLRKKYPWMDLVELPSRTEGFERVAQGTLDASIEVYRVAAYAVRREYVGQLKVNTRLDPVVMKGHAGISKKDPLLKSIFDKAILAVPEEEKVQMIDRWMRSEKIRETDYRLLTAVAALFLILIAGLIVYFYRERRHQQRLLARQTRLAGMGAMINNIAHQWRQPLQRINSSVAVVNTMLRSGKVEPVLLEKKMQSIQETTRYMSDTIEDFMHFFRPNKQREAFRVSETVQRALALLESRTRGVEILFRSDGDDRIHGCEKELLQALLNLLNNALDQLEKSETPSPRIEISIRRSGQELILEVHDSGGGIPPEILERIFDPYFTTKFAQEGTGLGLYMAKMIVEESLGGRLEVRNGPEGARFILSFKGEEEDA